LEEATCSKKQQTHEGLKDELVRSQQSSHSEGLNFESCDRIQHINLPTADSNNNIILTNIAALMWAFKVSTDCQISFTLSAVWTQIRMKALALPFSIWDLKVIPFDLSRCDSHYLSD
jgi:hypothetical protein